MTFEYFFAICRFCNTTFLVRGPELSVNQKSQLGNIKVKQKCTNGNPPYWLAIEPSWWIMLLPGFISI